jgi:hypothetical protein
VTKKSKKRKPRFRVMRFRKGDHSHNLLAAVQKYVHAHGGSLIVIGGIEVQRWPGDGEHKFKIAVGCLGTAPTKPEKRP